MNIENILNKKGLTGLTLEESRLLKAWQQENNEQAAKSSDHVMLNPAIVFSIPENQDTWDWLDAAKKIMQEERIIGDFSDPSMNKDGSMCFCTFRVSCPEHFNLVTDLVRQRVESIKVAPDEIVFQSTVEEDKWCPNALRTRREAEKLHRDNPMPLNAVRSFNWG